MKSKNYTQYLTEEDKLDISFKENRGKIIKFSVNYSALINERWRYIMRIDNCHGQPHRHTYHLQRRQYWVLLGGNINEVFTEGKKYIKKDFIKIKENYLRVKPRNI